MPPVVTKIRIGRDVTLSEVLDPPISTSNGLVDREKRPAEGSNRSAAERLRRERSGIPQPFLAQELEFRHSIDVRSG
jgi:hypothetical protein